MALNKIIYKDRTLIDLTNTTAVGTGGGSLKLCLKHSAGQFTPPAGCSQTLVGDIGFIIEK